MRRSWEGTGWSDEKERAFQEGWARRVQSCPRKRCRRQRRCSNPREGKCPGLKLHPFTEEESVERVRMIRAVLRNRLREWEAEQAALAERDGEGASRKRSGR